MDQPPAVAFTAFADSWPRAIETEIGAALCATGRGKGLCLDWGFVVNFSYMWSFNFIFYYTFDTELSSTSGRASLVDMGIRYRAIAQGYFFLTKVELSVSVFGVWAELLALLEEICRIVGGNSWKIVAKIVEKGKWYSKVVWWFCCFEEIALHCWNMDIVFIIFAESWVAFFKIFAEIWVPNLNQNGTSPSKVRPPLFSTHRNSRCSY